MKRRIDRKARTGRRREVVTEARMAGMMVSLYPVKGWRRNPPPFRFGFVPIDGTPLGCCLDANWPKRLLRKHLKEYASFTGRPLSEVREEVLDHGTSLLLVDPFACDFHGWGWFLLVAIHEYAHFLRTTLSAIYRTDWTVRNFEESIDRQYAFADRVTGKRSFRKSGPLFGGWCHREGDADNPISHDPLFYFILYFLERKAAEKGYFGMRAEPANAGC